MTSLGREFLARERPPPALMPYPRELEDEPRLFDHPLPVGSPVALRIVSNDPDHHYQHCNSQYHPPVAIGTYKGETR